MGIYLDNSATTKVIDEAAKKAYDMMITDFGNPSSLHHMGVVAEEELETARKRVASLLARDEKGIIFTASGTEANNFALSGVSQSMRKRGNKIITSKVEHPSVLEQIKILENSGFEIVYLETDSRGVVKIDALDRIIDDDTILVSLMTANNEIGTIQPLGEIAKFKSKYNFVFHTDMVQAYGKIDRDFIPKEVDIITVSGHKIHAPKGVGAVWIKEKINIKPLIVGGGQERGLRSGTENVPAIAAFGIASEIAKKELESNISSMSEVRNYLWNRINSEIKDIKLNTPIENSVASVLNISFLGVRAEVLLHTLEQKGIYVSTGSACSSNKKSESYVLRAIGLKSGEIEGAVRFSFSKFNTVEEMDIVAEELKSAVEKFRSLGSFR